MARDHQRPHRGLDGQTPLDRWSQVGYEVRWLEPWSDLDDVCLLEERRKRSARAAGIFAATTNKSGGTPERVPPRWSSVAPSCAGKRAGGSRSARGPRPVKKDMPSGQKS